MDGLKRLFAVMLAAAATVTLIMLIVGGNEMELRDKDWGCEEVEAGFDCRVEVTLINYEDSRLKVGVKARGFSKGADGKMVKVVEEEWFELLPPEQQLRSSHRFQAGSRVERLLLMATPIKSELLGQ
jgi:hypothetical protein